MELGISHEAHLCSILDVTHSKNPIEALDIETGKIPIRFILQKRILVYWLHVAKLKPESLLN